MPVLTPKVVTDLVNINVRLPREVVEQIDDYCSYLDGHCPPGALARTDRSHIITEAVRRALAHDRGFRSQRKHSPNPPLTAPHNGTGGAPNPAPPVTATDPNNDVTALS